MQIIFDVLNLLVVFAYLAFPVYGIRVLRKWNAVVERFNRLSEMLEREAEECLNE